jgi:hypothetical protein
MMFWRHALCLVTASNGEFVLSNFLLDPGRDSTELKLPGIRDLTLLLLIVWDCMALFVGKEPETTILPLLTKYFC